MTVNGDRHAWNASKQRALGFVLLALQLVAFTVGAAFAGQTQPHARARAFVTTTTTSSADGAVRPSAPDARLEGARPRGERDAHRGAPPIELATLVSLVAVGAASLTGSLDWGTAARDHRPPPSIVNGARGPPLS